MPGFQAGLFVDPLRRTGAVVLANGTAGLRADRLPVELLDCMEEVEGTVPVPWRPVADVPEAVQEVLGVWHWGNSAQSFAWDGREVVVTALARGAVAHRFAPRDDGSFVGTAGYHHGERLSVVRREDGSISHLECATFVFTRTPYDPSAPIPS
jgi:hypothetical protein